MRLNSIVSWLWNHPHIYAVLIGLSIGLPFIYPMLLPVAYVGLIAVWYLLDNISRQQLLVILPLLFGTKALLALTWFWSTYPITWLADLSSVTQITAIFLYWFSSAIWLASAGIALAIFLRFEDKFFGLLRDIYRVCVLILAEFLGSVVFSILTIGPGGSVTGAFSFGHSGYLFPWLYPVAQFGGVYAVGIVGVLLCVLVYRCWRLRSRTYAVAFVLITVCIVGLYSTLTTHIQPHTIALVQTTINSTTGLSQKERSMVIGDMVNAAKDSGAQYVLLPEDARYLIDGFQVVEVGVPDAVSAWQVFNPTSTAVVIDSGRSLDKGTGQIVQRAYVWGDGDTHYTADKSYLVPQGEYMPSLYAFFLQALGLGGVAKTLSEKINYTEGIAQIALQAPATIPNILFCFESVSPLAAKQLMKIRPSDFIVHPISHSWFHEPKVLWQQLETMLRFQSVSAGVPIVSAGNDVRGQVYLPDGGVVTPITIATFPYGTVDIITLSN